jgi:hypothetical protein
MSNITSFLNLSTPVNIHDFVFVPLEDVQGGRFVRIIDMTVKATHALPGIVVGGCTSELVMKVSSFVLSSIISTIKRNVRTRNEDIERMLGYSLGSVLWGSYVDTFASGYFATGMKIGSVISALKTAVYENNIFRFPEELRVDRIDEIYAINTGLASGSIVVLGLQYCDVSFVTSLAIGSLTANQVTKAYFRLKQEGYI